MLRLNRSPNMLSSFRIIGGHMATCPKCGCEIWESNGTAPDSDDLKRPVTCKQCGYKTKVCHVLITEEIPTPAVKSEAPAPAPRHHITFRRDNPASCNKCGHTTFIIRDSDPISFDQVVVCAHCGYAVKISKLASIAPPTQIILTGVPHVS